MRTWLQHEIMDNTCDWPSSIPTQSWKIWETREQRGQADGGTLVLCLSAPNKGISWVDLTLTFLEMGSPAVNLEEKGVGWPWMEKSFCWVSVHILPKYVFKEFPLFNYFLINVHNVHLTIIKNNNRKDFLFLCGLGWVRTIKVLLLNSDFLLLRYDVFAGLFMCDVTRRVGTFDLFAITSPSLRSDPVTFWSVCSCCGDLFCLSSVVRSSDTCQTNRDIFVYNWLWKHLKSQEAGGLIFKKKCLRCSDCMKLNSWGSWSKTKGNKRKEMVVERPIEEKAASNTTTPQTQKHIWFFLQTSHIHTADKQHSFTRADKGNIFYSHKQVTPNQMDRISRNYHKIRSK